MIDDLLDGVGEVVVDVVGTVVSGAAELGGEVIGGALEAVGDIFGGGGADSAPSGQEEETKKKVAQP